MQRLTFEMIGSRAPLSELNPEDIRERLNTVGYLDPSIILRTNNTVIITRDRNIYNIQTNLKIDIENNVVSDSGTITLLKDNFGIQELLVNVETETEPAYAELTNYSIDGNVITLDTQDYNNKSAIIKYLTTL